MLLDQLKNKFNCDKFIITERVKVVNISFHCSNKFLDTIESIDEILLKFPSRDDVKLIFSNECDEEIFFSINNLPTKEKWDEFLESLTPGTCIEGKFDIYKKIENNVFSIYSFNEFSKDLNSLSMLNFMKALSTIICETDQGIIFDMLDESQMFLTSTFKFIPHSQIGMTIKFNDRLNCIANSKSSILFNYFDKINLSPLDFVFESDYTSNPLTDIFNKVSTLLALIYISNSSTVTENSLNIQIIGQRTLNENICLNSVVYNQHIVNICSWIYLHSFSTDKLMIARNMISLHCKNMSLLFLDDKTLSSIHSNFNLYLKENVDRYLDLKNELSTFLYELVVKTSEYSMQILSKLKSNLFAMGAFILTVFISNTTSSQPLNNIFTRDITAISEMIIFGSFVFMILSIFEHNNNLKDIEDGYNLIKTNYQDLLSEDDINKIFDNDNVKNKAMETVKKWRNRYIFLWIALLIACLICIEKLSTTPIISIFFLNFKDLVCIFLYRLCDLVCFLKNLFFCQ